MNNQLLKLYESMKRIRMVESAIADNYNNEIREMHTPIHLYDGQDAVAEYVHSCPMRMLFLVIIGAMGTIWLRVEI